MHEVGDAVREHAGLARAGARHHEQRTTPMHHGIELVGVERLQVERVEIEAELAVVAHGATILGTGCHVAAALRRQ